MSKRELGVGVVDLDQPRRGWVHELRTGLWLKHLPTDKRPVTKDQVVDFEPGRSLWVDTPDTLLFRMDIAKGDPYQPDNLILCDQPPPPGFMRRFLRRCACDTSAPLSSVLRNAENQSNLAIDPDGS